VVSSARASYGPLGRSDPTAAPSQRCLALLKKNGRIDLWHLEHEHDAAVATLWRALARGLPRRSLAESGRARTFGFGSGSLLYASVVNPPFAVRWVPRVASRDAHHHPDAKPKSIPTFVPSAPLW